MTGALYLIGLVGVLYANLAALTLLAMRLVPIPAIARAAGVIGVCLVFFSAEHFVGFGDIGFAALPLTAASLFILWRAYRSGFDPAFLRGEAVFAVALAIGFLWRLPFPEIVEDNDRLTDFHLVVNYMAGDRLPPVDYWIPAARLDYYYTFQQYAAALLGRLLGLDAGTSFNLGAIVLAALVLALAWSFLEAIGVGRAGRWLASAALIIGGTGVSPLFHLLTAPLPEGVFTYASGRHAFFYNSRFVGWFEEKVASPAFASLAGDEARSPVLLPIETFGYQYPLGGFHAPLSGFLLLFLALAVMAWIPRVDLRLRQRLELILGMTVPLVACSNAWVLPLQAALVGGWKLFDARTKEGRDIRFLLAGAALATVLLLPFLAGLAAGTGHLRLHLVPPEAASPILQTLIVWWPLLALAALVALAGLTRSLAGFFALLFVGLFLLAQVLNASDGGYRGDFLRFNPALKWWGWIFTGGVFTLSAFLLAAPQRWSRTAGVAVLVLVSTFLFDSGRFVAFRDSKAPGRLDGAGYYARKEDDARLIDYLATAPQAIVLEAVRHERPNDTGIFAGFGQKRSLIGIPWVMRVWKRGQSDLPYLEMAISEFYDGKHDDPLRFLRDHDVRYVVWPHRQQGELDEWHAIDTAIARDFAWIEMAKKKKGAKKKERHVGLWIRRDAALPVAAGPAGKNAIEK